MTHDPTSSGTSTDVDIFTLSEQMHHLIQRACLMLGLLVVALNLGGVLHKINFRYFRETALFVSIGWIVGFLFVTITKGNAQKDEAIQLSNSFFYIVLLPPIIFEAGFNLQRLLFLNNSLAILLLAFVGAVYSSVVTSSVLYCLTWVSGISLSMSEALVFGAMISSTDPVTVLSLLPESVDRRLYMLIFGESALNDAVSMILYKFFTELAEEDLTFMAFGRAVWSSALIFTSSVIVGIAVALLYALMTKHIRPPEPAVFQTIMIIVFGYLSYLLAEISGATGVISIFFCGIGMSHYAVNNIGDTGLLSIKVMFRVFATIAETFIFLYLGLGLCAFGSEAVTYNPLMILFAMVAILISRSHVFLICGFCNLLEPHASKRIPLKHQTLLWFCGLRGAVCFCLGLQILQNNNFDVQSRALIFGTTLVVIVITVLVMGGMTPLMLKWLGLDSDAPEHHDDILALDQEEDTSHLTAREAPLPDDGLRPLVMRFIELDQRYLRPFFSRPPKTSRKIVQQGLSVLNLPRIAVPLSANRVSPIFEQDEDISNIDKTKFVLEEPDEDTLKSARAGGSRERPAKPETTELKTEASLKSGGYWPSNRKESLKTNKIEMENVVNENVSESVTSQPRSATIPEERRNSASSEKSFPKSPQAELTSRPFTGTGTGTKGNMNAILSPKIGADVSPTELNGDRSTSRLTGGNIASSTTANPFDIGDDDEEVFFFHKEKGEAPR